MHKRLDKGLTLGLVGNLLFVAFGFICYIYYITYDYESIFSKVVEIIAYTVEFAGFGILIYAVSLIWSSARMRNWLKTGYTVYIAVEAVMMILELNSFRLEFYKPYSLALAIFHSVFSAMVCFAFLQFDPNKTCLESMIIICIGIILGGMLGNIMGVRIYFSIITNAFGFALLFFSIKYMLKREMIEIDCHGDKARVAEYSSSTFFTDNSESKSENKNEK